MKRSDFLKTIAFGAAGTVFLPRISRAEEMIKTPVNDVSDPTKVLTRFVNSGPSTSKKIALTLDDGPTPGVTDSILKNLSDRKLKATFFMIGERIKEFPALAKEVTAAGHEVANHTFTHPNLSLMSTAKVYDQLRRTQSIIGNTLGVYPAWFRPPYGAFKKSQGPIALDMGLGVAYWSVDTVDWSRPGVDKIVERAVGQARDGSIILCHDMHQQTAQAMPRILDGLLEKGFEFATMTELIGEPYPTV